MPPLRPPPPLPRSFASIAKVAGQQLGQHVERIIPRLYRYLYDPSPKAGPAFVPSSSASSSSSSLGAAADVACACLSAPFTVACLSQVLSQHAAPSALTCLGARPVHEAVVNGGSAVAMPAPPLGNASIVLPALYTSSMICCVCLQVRDAMSHIWHALLDDPKRAVAQHFPAIATALLRDMGGNQWRAREAAAAAMADALQARAEGGLARKVVVGGRDLLACRTLLQVSLVMIWARRGRRQARQEGLGSVGQQQVASGSPCARQLLQQPRLSEHSACVRARATAGAALGGAEAHL